MSRDAESVALGQLPAPAGLTRCRLDDTPQAASVHGVPLRGFAVIPGIAQGLRGHLAGRTDHLQQKVLRVPAGGRGQLGDERLDRERMRNVRNRSEPADARMSDRLGVLDAHVGNRERHVDDAHAQLERRLVLRLSIERGDDGRRHAPVQPGDRLALGVDPGLEVLDRHRVVVGIVKVVIARPRHLHRFAVHRLGQDGCLEGEVGLRLASKAAAEQRDVHGHVVR